MKGVVVCVMTTAPLLLGSQKTVLMMEGKRWVIKGTEMYVEKTTEIVKRKTQQGDLSACTVLIQ